MNSSLCSTVRVGINTVRYADIYYERTNQSKITGHISVVQNGDQITISGSGSIFETFENSDMIQQLTGMSEKPVTFFEPGFQTASLRKMRLDESYCGMQYDVRDSKK